MSFRNCMNGKIRAGLADKDRGKEVLDLFDEIEAEARTRMGPEEAARFAGDEAMRQIKFQAADKKRLMALSAAVHGRIEKDIKLYRDGSGQENLPRAAEALLDGDDWAPYGNVAVRRREVLGAAHSMMDNVLATFRRRLSGQVREPARLNNMVRELYGENSGDGAARELSQAWTEAAEYLRQRFNRSGGKIPRREDWGLPQMHDTIKVRKASFDDWRASLVLDRARMIDEATGQPITRERLEIALRDVYETIATDGGNKLTPSGRAVGRSLANKRLDHRFLVFKSADDWLAYNEQFGMAEPFSAMMGHLDSMSRDISLMEIMGPNPNATKVWLEQSLTKDAKLRQAKDPDGGHINRANKSINRINAMYRQVTGETSSPVDSKLSNVLVGTRQFLVSAQLGAAFLSALSDLSFQRQAAKYSGIPQTKVLGQLLKQFSPGRMEDKKLAVRLGLIAENWSQRALAQSRYTGDAAFGEIGGRLSDFVMRASLLSPWTQAGRHAFGMEFLGMMADRAGDSFDVLPDVVQKTFRNYGIGAGAWDKIRTTELLDQNGATFFDPARLRVREDLFAGEGDRLATQVMEMVLSETEFAVPSTSLRGRVALTGDTQPGTIGGEIMRSFAMYKSFAATIFFTHIRRGVQMDGLGKKGVYFGELMIATTLMGALALQAKQVTQGKDPRPMTDAAFWGAATIQGGGLGIFGDFLYSSENRFGGGAASTISGPVSGVGQDILALTFGNISELVQGEDPKLGRDVVNFAKRYTPGGSLWYSRLAYERMVLDQLQEKVDPKAGRAFRAKEKKMKREFGQKYWWAPGEPLPDRAPDVENVLEER